MFEAREVTLGSRTENTSWQLPVQVFGSRRGGVRARGGREGPADESCVPQCQAGHFCSQPGSPTGEFENLFLPWLCRLSKENKRKKRKKKQKKTSVLGAPSGSSPGFRQVGRQTFIVVLLVAFIFVFIVELIVVSNVVVLIFVFIVK